VVLSKSEIIELLGGRYLSFIEWLNTSTEPDVIAVRDYWNANVSFDSDNQIVSELAQVVKDKFGVDLYEEGKLIYVKKNKYRVSVGNVENITELIKKAAIYSTESVGYAGRDDEYYYVDTYGEINSNLFELVV